ncbi:MAG: SirB1 family protein [Terriglobales bacterium]
MNSIVAGAGKKQRQNWEAAPGLTHFASMVFVGDDRKAGAVAEAFALLVGQQVEDERIPLDRAALTIARTEYPDLDFEPYLRRLGELATRVTGRLSRIAGPDETIAALNHVLFREEGFRGNRQDYYDPRNSFFNDVLDRKLGIPITLALVYMEVARRIGFPLFGVGMPGHFLLKHYDVEGHETLIDAFNDGAIVTAGECQSRLDEIYSGQLPLQPEFLLSVSRRQMLTRILNNLKNVYMGARNMRKALQVVDLICAMFPRSPEDVKQRAALRYSVGQMRGALEDLEEYLKMSPDASDADDIRHTALAIRRTLARLN